MIYLTDRDVQLLLKDEFKGQITDSDPTLFNDIELQAIDEASAYLRSRYNMPSEFAKTGTGRSAKLVQIITDITLYHIHSRISPRNISELRVKRYDDQIAFLKAVSKGTLTMDLAVLTSAPTSNIEYGTNESYGSQSL